MVQMDPRRGSALAPLGVPIFRRIWTSSLLSNFGHLILGVAAAWEMTRLSDSTVMVALVQTALMAPLMLVALPAGALADMFDRRKIALAGLALACCAGCVLAAVGFAGLITPWLLLGLLFVIGAGVALYGPAWQSSISELVPVTHLPSAVALGSVSYNLARSFGPAVGGVIVLAAGAQAAFAVNALGYIPLLLAIFFWRREHISSRLPPERLNRALVSGLRYARHASSVRNALVRSFLFGFAGATSTAMAPLIAQDVLNGDAAVYGLLLGASGGGAVLGSLVTTAARDRLGPENAIRCATFAAAAALIGIGISTLIWLSAALFLVQGAMTMLVFSMLNIGIQLSTPRWVLARALSLFSASVTGGVAIGAVLWGGLADQIGIPAIMIISGSVLGVTMSLGFVLPLRREISGQSEQVAIDNQPNTALALTPRSGPIVIEIDYRVALDSARDFYQAMQSVGETRRRNGGFNWSLSRDIAVPQLWTERYICPTWGDYLHLRDRYTKADMEAQERVEALNSLHDDSRIRRRLERPYGSVRWRSDTPDSGTDMASVLAP